MIRFFVDGDIEGPGYVLVAEADYQAPVRSDPLPNARAIALQARELAEAAAALLESLLLESLLEHEKAFEALHDALDSLPMEASE